MAYCKLIFKEKYLLFIMSILNTFFDKIFIINLDSRKDRWTECLELLKKYNITNFERISAIRPIYKNIPKNYYSNLEVNQAEWYVTGCVGCKLSHYKVIALAKNRNYHNFLVLEDDFSIDLFDFEKQIKLALDELKHTQWDMIYLGGNNLIKPTDINNYKYLHEAKQVNTTHAYAMNHTLYDKCLEKIPICGTEIDVFYKREIQKINKVFCIYPSLIKQRKSKSNIFNSVMDYKFD